MKTVTQAFVNAWTDKSKKFAVRQIKYKRRYWSTSAFVYESSWQTLAMKDFTQIDTMSQQLDTVALNEFKMSNITLSLNNTNNQWLPYNVGGKFGADAVATSGYQAYKTMFQILAGYELADGTEELLTLFTGFLVDYSVNTGSKNIDMYILCYGENLDKADAQLVSDAFTDEVVIGDVDGSNQDFKTTAEGVHYVSEVTDNGTAQTEGLQYTISNTNVYEDGAAIAFEDAPLAAHTLLASGKKWRADQTVEYLVRELCNTAAIGSGTTYSDAYRDIQSVLFAGGLNSSKTINSQAEWEAGTFTACDASTSPGTLQLTLFMLDDFSGDLSKWTVLVETAGAWSIVGGMLQSVPTLVGAMFCSIQYNTFSDAYGIWQFKAWGQEEAGPNNIRFVLIGDVLMSTFARPTNGYTINLGQGQVILEKWTTSTYTALKTITYSGGENDVYRVHRNTSGIFEIFINDVSYGTATDNTITTSAGIFLSVQGVQTLYFDDIKFRTVDGDADWEVGIYESTEFDLLAAPTGWGTLDKNEVLNAGDTVTYYTAVCDTLGGVYDAWTAISGTGQILSELKQYLKIKITLQAANNTFTVPSVQNITANYTSTQVFVALANFAGMTCYTAIQQLGKLCDYEWGFDGTGKFFFKKKNLLTAAQILAAGSQNFTFTQKNVIEITSLRPGWDGIINNGQIRYKEYYKEYTCTTAPDASPTSADIYGECIKSDDVSQFLLANDADLATAASRVLHDNNYIARLRVDVVTPLIPHAELADIVKFSFYDDPLDEDNVLGDQLQSLGDSAFGQAGDATLLRDKIFKIVSMVHNFNAETTEFSLLEVL